MNNIVNMAEEKSRVSGESPSRDQAGPILPTTTQEAEKPQAPKESLHPAFYVV